MTSKLAESPQTRRQRAEEKFRAYEAAPLETLSPEAVQQLFQELRGHQIELEMQKEELRLRKCELEDLRIRYFDLYDLAPVGYLTVSDKGLIREVNLTAAILLGAPRESLMNRRVSRFIFKDDQDSYYFKRKQALKLSSANLWRLCEPLSIELRVVKNGGMALWVLLMITCMQESSGTFLRITMSDISGRKQAEYELKQAYSELEARVIERSNALNRSLEQEKRLYTELLWAEERERERIAKELHDQVGQSLLLAKMKLDALAVKIPSDLCRTTAEEIAALLSKTINDIRSLTFRMRPPILDTAGIDVALEWLCSSIHKDFALQIDFIDDRLPKPLSPKVRYALYQVVRELLINIVKHAKVEKAQLTIKAVDDCVVVEVMDNGAGFNYPEVSLTPDKKDSYGLYTVRQRMEYLGGEFTVESSPGLGTTTTLMVRAEIVRGV